MVKEIGEYALVGDCETAALISRSGVVEWLCWPAFDSEACFAALLGDRRNGCWALGPVGPVTACTRRYLEDTLVLETRFECASGVVTLTDFMPVRGEASDLIRIVRCEAGEVEMESEIVLRFDYGRLAPWLTKHEGAVTALAGPSGIRICANVELRVSDGDCVSRFAMRAGEEVSFAITYFESHRRPPAPVHARRALAATVDHWRDWIGRCGYGGPARGLVRRSLIVLKALTYRPTGGLVAAATSSVPENEGGDRNWDYRFCWLRDATFTLLSLLQAGFKEEAAAWRDWLLRAAAGAPADLQPVYSVRGKRRLMEWEASWLPGMNGVGPVRIGNSAAGQRQLDIFGEVVDALHQAERHGVAMNSSEREFQQALVHHVERTWREPDRGIWEMRGSPQRFTHSQVMAWVAVDRAVKSADQIGLGQSVGNWRALKDRMHAEICEGCYDPAQGAFTQTFGSSVLDASVLLIPHLGFLPATDPRMVSTVEAIRRELEVDGFIRRYDPAETSDGLCQPEAPFLASSFWLADNLVMQGRRGEAEALFERLLSACNDLGLLAEEYDPRTRRGAGNFPQALSHLSLVNTAYNLSGWGPAQERGEQG